MRVSVQIAYSVHHSANLNVIHALPNSSNSCW